MRDRSREFGNKHISHNKSILQCKDTVQRTQGPKHRKVNPDDPVIHIAHLQPTPIITHVEKIEVIISNKGWS